jgi:hypothetical protein
MSTGLSASCCLRLGMSAVKSILAPRLARVVKVTSPTPFFALGTNSPPNPSSCARPNGIRTVIAFTRLSRRFSVSKASSRNNGWTDRRYPPSKT